MTSFYEIIKAGYHCLRLRVVNPRISRCMLVGVVLVLATAGPIAQAHNAVNQTEQFPRFAMVREIAVQVFGGSTDLVEQQK